MAIPPRIMSCRWGEIVVRFGGLDYIFKDCRLAPKLMPKYFRASPESTSRIRAKGANTPRMGLEDMENQPPGRCGRRHPRPAPGVEAGRSRHYITGPRGKVGGFGRVGGFSPLRGIRISRASHASCGGPLQSLHRRGQARLRPLPQHLLGGPVRAPFECRVSNREGDTSSSLTGKLLAAVSNYKSAFWRSSCVDTSSAHSGLRGPNARG